MVSIIILYYNIMGPPPYLQSVVDRNVVMLRIPVHSSAHRGSLSPLYNVYLSSYPQVGRPERDVDEPLAPEVKENV